MPYALHSPEDDLSPRHALALDVILGSTVGTLFGLLVGLADSTTVTSVAVAATALAGAVLVLRGCERAVRPLRAGTLAVTAVAALLAGTYIERQGLLGPTPADDVAAWQAAGLDLQNAQAATVAQWTKGKAKLTPPAPAAKKTAGKKPLSVYCADLERLQWKPERELLSWKRRGGTWAESAAWVEKHVPCHQRAETVVRLRKLACAQQGE